MRSMVAAVICVASLGAAVAASSAGADLSRGERKFLEGIARHSMAEIQTGKIAEARGANREVKNFGKLMVEEHGKGYESVVQLAKAKGIALPGEPDAAHWKQVDKLKALSGAEFDRRYVEAMIKDHEKDVKAFQKMSRGAKDPDVKTFATKTLPMVEGHLAMARQLKASAGKAK